MKLSRALALLMVMLLAVGITMPAQGSTLGRERLYDGALRQLEDYQTQTATMTLDEIFMSFSEVGSWGYGREFAVYVDVLRQIEKGEFGTIFVYISLLKSNEKFCGYLAELERLGTVEELECYAQGRMLEANGDMPAAMECYNKCLNFMDSMDRALQHTFESLETDYQQALDYYKKGTLEGYEKAYGIFSELAAQYNYKNSAALMETTETFIQALRPKGTYTPAPAKASAVITPGAVAATNKPAKATATPKPVVTPDPARNFALTTTALNGQVRLNWSAPFSGATYTIYRKMVNGSWRQVGTTSNNYYFDGSVSASTSYEYYVQAKAGSRQVNSRQVSVISASAATPTPKPKTWGAWSAWSTTPVSASSTREVQTKVEDVYTEKYKYTKWHYYTTKGTWWNAPDVFYDSSIFSSKKDPYWMSTTEDEPLPAAGVAQYHGSTYTYYGNYWFNPQKIQVKTGTVTYYRYRELK